MEDEAPPQQITVRIAQMTRDLKYLVGKANKRGFATEEEIKKMARLRADIAAVKTGGDFKYVGGDD